MPVFAKTRENLCPVKFSAYTYSYNSPSICSRCESNYYGRQCEVDGEVIVVAIGASVAAVFIIVLTLICLCMWR